jgi:pimeloyl-ACP methyl ester carboxylesterase
VKSANVPLVLIPGHMGTMRDWRWQCEEFRTDREIFVPDSHHWLRSIPDMAIEIAPQLPPRFDLIGWSMGGYVAFELYPLVHTRVRRAALIHTSARPENDAARRRRRQLLRAVETQGMSAVFERELHAGVVDQACLGGEFVAQLLAERLRLGRQALENQIEALSGRADSRPRLRDWRCETLVVAGRGDAVVPPECALEIAALLPHPQLHVFEDTGHCSPWERTGEFNTLLREFLG